MSTPQPQSRGRNAVSKPLHGRSTTKSKSRSTAISGTVDGGNSKQVTRPPSVSSSKSSVRSTSSLSKNAPGASVKPAEPEQFKVTKVSSTTVKLSSTWTPPPPQSKAAPPQETTRTYDTLQVAAQVYPWTYMSSTLDACFKSAEAAANKDLGSRAKELELEESAISEQRDRLEAQRAIEFYDELGSELFAKEAPAIMQWFHSHGDSCTKIETEALNLAASPNSDEEDPLKPYNQMLDELEKLRSEATRLQDSISRLIERASATSDKAPTEGILGNEDHSGDPNAAEPTARQQIVNVFAACLPVLTARMANLSMAQELVDSALENASLSLRMESLGID